MKELGKQNTMKNCTQIKERKKEHQRNARTLLNRILHIFNILITLRNEEGEKIYSSGRTDTIFLPIMLIKDHVYICVAIQFYNPARGFTILFV